MARQNSEGSRRERLGVRAQLEYYDLGLVFDPSECHEGLRYSQVPTPIFLSEEVIRIYLAGRSSENETFIYSIDVCSDDPTRILDIRSDPILAPGKLGCFDENGTMPSCVILENEKLFLFYSGWSIRKTVPYNNLTGCAVSDQSGDFERLSAGPVLGQSLVDPLSATSPWIIKHNYGYLMFYCAGLDWIEINGKLEHTYNIKTARSDDGVNWTPTGNVAVEQKSKEEAITRPTVLAGNDGFHMWFCFRQSKDFRGGSGSYKIGYAYSQDLITWDRAADPIALKNRKFGSWAGNMQAYPAAIRVKENKYLFYNGNGFGMAGFGVIKII